MPNWSQAVFDPVKARGGVPGNEYVDRIFDAAARRDAGSKYASGDYKGASSALAKRGDFAGAGAIQNTQIQRAQAQHEFIRKAAPVFQAALAKDGPEGVLRAYQMIGPDLEALGVPKEQIASDMQRFQQDPQGAVGMLTAFAQTELRDLGGGDVGIFANGKLVERIKGTPEGPSQAESLREANSPFKADGSANMAVQAYEASQRARPAGGGGSQESWNQPVTETGPDGKPIVVRYGSRGGRQVVTGATPRPSAQEGSGLTRLQVGRAKEKISGLSAIENQIQRVERAIEGAEKEGYTGYFAGNVPGGLDPESDTFDKSASLLAALIRQLTRTPGEGAMSDYETRLATLTLPTRTDTPEGRRESLAGLRDLINQIRTGYSELLGEPTGQPITPPPGGMPSPSTVASGPKRVGRFVIEPE